MLGGALLLTHWSAACSLHGQDPVGSADDAALDDPTRRACEAWDAEHGAERVFQLALHHRLPGGRPDAEPPRITAFSRGSPTASRAAST